MASKHKWQEKLALLEWLKNKLGSDVFNFTVKPARYGNTPDVVFTRHPTVHGKRPGLAALKAHVDGITTLTFDPPGKPMKAPMPWFRPMSDVIGQHPEQ